MKKQQSGFTLIELVVVIVILGILSAVAIPRFVNLGSEARAGSVDAMVGAMRGAVNIVQSTYLARNFTTQTEVLLQNQTAGNGVVVAAGSGIPAGSANGIGRALVTVDGYTADASAPAGTYRLSPGTAYSSNCNASYDGSTGAVTFTKSGC